MAAASAAGASSAAASTAGMTSERALVHLYNPVTRAWSQQPATTIAVESQPFGEGNFRQAYRARMAVDGKAQEFVIKVARDPNTPRSLYFNDAEAQGVAILWAKKYNESKPPKAVEFVPCFVVELVDRPGRPLANCEQHIRGEFKKYNNNVGAAVGGGMGVGGAGGNGGHASAASAAAESSLEARTAQCFSHFTYQHSGCQILICDIQGVGGLYTDPQIHTVTGKGFGEGNLGGAGITAFLLRHTCNDLCAQLGLSKVQPKNLDSSNAKVVLPVNAAPLLASKASGASSGGSKSGAGSGGADILVIDSSSSGSSASASGGGGGATPKKPYAGGSHSAADAAGGDRKATSGPAGARASAIASKSTTTLTAAAGGVATGSSKSSSKSQSQQHGAAPAAAPTDAPMEVRGHGHVKQPSLSPRKSMPTTKR